MTERIILAPSPRQDYDKRRWDKWPELADRLVERFGAVCFVGIEEQADYVNSIIAQMHNAHAAKNYCGAFDILEFMKFLREARLIVSVNTFTMHAGIVLKIPTVAIIGGTPASIVADLNNPLFRYVEDPALANWNPETAEYGRPRINEITAQEVMAQIDALGV